MMKIESEDLFSKDFMEDYPEFVTVYRGALRGSLLKVEFSDKLEAALFATRWMNAGQEVFSTRFSSGSCIVEVPVR